MRDLDTHLAEHVDRETDRFHYQRAAARFACKELSGPVLNVGCKEDPAQLKAFHPDRVVNCDLVAYDELHDRPNVADVLFDCARDTWPFPSNSVAMVVMGDILEHLEGQEIGGALREARRVSATLCLTVPMDTEVSEEFASQWSRGVRHRTCFTAATLREAVQAAGWQIAHFRTVDYVFLPVGFLMCCV